MVGACQALVVEQMVFTLFGCTFGEPEVAILYSRSSVVLKTELSPDADQTCEPLGKAVDQNDSLG